MNDTVVEESGPIDYRVVELPAGKASLSRLDAESGGERTAVAFFGARRSWSRPPRGGGLEIGGTRLW